MALALLLAFLIGLVAGLRSLTAPAVVAWATHRHWIEPHPSLSLIGSNVAVAALTLLAVGELVFDKLPWAPSRTEPVGLIGRIVFGALSGAVIASSLARPLVLGGLLGGV